MYFREHSNPLRHADIHSAQLCDLGTSQKKLLSYICRAVGKPEKLKGGGAKYSKFCTYTSTPTKI